MITEHPVGGDVPTGMNITLQCKATGLGILKFAWERRHFGSWTVISTESTTSYTATISGFYRCKVTNEAGSVVSNRTVVNIYGENTFNSCCIMIQVHTGPPAITTQPASQLSTVGMTITLNCEATGRGSMAYYWEERVQGSGWGMINNSNNSTLTIRNVKQSNQFRCTVHNEAGSTTSNPANVTILGKR